MNEARLRELLGAVEVPEAAAAERRGRALVQAAYAERTAVPAPRPTLGPRRLALAVALAALLAALLLSPAGAAVRDWVGDVFDGGGTEIGLGDVPGGGRLLVQSEAGPWVVQSDGSRRLLGDYREATWSPHGLFLAVVAGRTLSAVEPNGTPRWSLPARRALADPRWSPSGYEIAYRSGDSLRVTGADGEGDHLVAARAAAPAPAWSPFRLPQLAYVGLDGRVRIVAAASGAILAEVPGLAALESLEWGAGGQLLERGAAALQVRAITIGKLTRGVVVGEPRRLSLPGATELRDAALSPDGRTVAALVVVEGPRGPRSVVRLITVADGSSRHLYSVAGRGLTELAWSPDGSRLLVARPRLDQWLFLPLGPREGRSLTGIAAAFSPGSPATAFPTVEGWCCRAALGG